MQLETEAKTATRRARRWPAAGALVLLLAAALWTGLWFHVAGNLRDGIAGWAAAREAEGWDVDWRMLSVEGFPVAWRAEIVAPRAARTGRAPPWFWRGPERLTLNYRPWSPRSFALAAPGRHVFGPDPQHSATIVAVTAQAVDGVLALGAEGRPERLTVAIDAAALSLGSAPPSRLDSLRATLAAGDPSGATAEPHRRPAARLEAVMTGLALPADTRPVLGRTVGRAAIDATLRGALPPAPLADALARWRDAGGTVEIARIELGWGPLGANADGTLALDGALQPEAAFAARISGYAETMDALVRARMVKSNAAFIAKLALGALARTPEGGGRPEIQVPVTIQNRQLFAGPVPLFILPAVEWD